MKTLCLAAVVGSAMACHCSAQIASVDIVSSPVWDLNPQFSVGTPGVATFDASFSPVAAGAIANVALLDGAYIFDFSITTQSDILLFDAVIESSVGLNQPGGWYNESANGVDTGPQPPAFINAVPQLGADSWMQTPGSTGVAGPARFDALNGEPFVTHSDSTDDFAQTDYNFAQFTLIPDADGNASATFRGQVQLRSPGEPVRENFAFNMSISAVPEPSSAGMLMAALMGALAFIRRRR